MRDLTVRDLSVPAPDGILHGIRMQSAGNSFQMTCEVGDQMITGVQMVAEDQPAGISFTVPLSWYG